MEPADLFASPPPRSGPAIDPLLRAASRHVRWFWYGILIFDAACLAVILGTAHPDDRWRYTFAFAVVFSLFTFPFYLFYRSRVGATRRLLADGQVIEAKVVKVRTGSMRGTPIHNVRVEFTDAAGKPRKGSLSMAGGKAGLGEGASLSVLSHAELKTNLFVAATPAHGVQPGRHEA